MLWSLSRRFDAFVWYAHADWYIQVIVTGDFNSKPHSRVYSFLCRRRLQLQTQHTIGSTSSSSSYSSSSSFPPSLATADDSVESILAKLSISAPGAAEPVKEELTPPSSALDTADTDDDVIHPTTSSDNDVTTSSASVSPSSTTGEEEFDVHSLPIHSLDLTSAYAGYSSNSHASAPTLSSTRAHGAMPAPIPPHSTSPASGSKSCSPGPTTSHSAPTVPHAAWPAEPHFTNYTERFKGTLDYIFYTSASLELLSILELPPLGDIAHHVALPNMLYSSDHLALKAEFAVRTQK